ncbi:MAG: NAD(+) synthase [Acetatifactor sp.]|nr:NAD(+) synthase [Acetatifactor sp.]
MEYGYIKTATASFDIQVAGVSANVDNMLRLMKQAREQQVELLVFPELCVTGYSCGDLFLSRRLLSQAQEGLKRLAEGSAGSNCLVVAGAPLCHNQRLYNCAVFLQDGQLRGIVPKSYIPGYKEFYEKRWFASGKQIQAEEEQGVPFGTHVMMQLGSDVQVAAEICEDLWVSDSPSIRHCLNGADLVVNLSASNETVSKKTYRQELVKMQSAKCMCGYIYASSGEGESTTDLVFSGHCMIAENGSIKAESYRKKEGLLTALIDVQKLQNDRMKMNSENEAVDMSAYVRVELRRDSFGHLPRQVDAYPFVPASHEKRLERCREIMELQANGLYERLKKTGLTKVVIGISGGLDSTLALLVTLEAYRKLGRDAEDIIAITMPGFGTSVRTRTNSDRLMELCGVTARTISITEACRQHMQDIGHPEDQYDVTYENIQARERTQILMDVANQEGGLVIGTGDLSETALGWCTYNGDHMSMYGVNISIPKTLVKYLVSAYAEMHPELEEVLTSICETVISPELLPLSADGQICQSTEETIGKYDLHDFILYHFVRNGFEREKIMALARIAFPQVSHETIEKTAETFFRRFFSQQFKRSCMPDGPKVGSVSLSPRGDWRMPSDASVADYL